MSKLLIQTTQPAESSSPNRIISHRSEKIADHHLQRLAIVYLRQSTQQQVLGHRESTARQYALTSQATSTIASSLSRPVASCDTSMTTVESQPCISLTSDAAASSIATIDGRANG